MNVRLKFPEIATFDEIVDGLKNKELKKACLDLGLAVSDSKQISLKILRDAVDDDKVSLTELADTLESAMDRRDLAIQAKKEIALKENELFLKAEELKLEALKVADADKRRAHELALIDQEAQIRDRDAQLKQQEAQARERSSAQELQKLDKQN